MAVVQITLGFCTDEQHIKVLHSSRFISLLYFTFNIIKLYYFTDEQHIKVLHSSRFISILHFTFNIIKLYYFKCILPQEFTKVLYEWLFIKKFPLWFKGLCNLASPNNTTWNLSLRRNYDHLKPIIQDNHWSLSLSLYVQVIGDIYTRLLLT